MMDGRKMEQIIRLILEEAGPQDLELLQGAIERRRGGLESGEEGRASPAQMARKVAAGVGQQVQQSLQQVHGMVREAVAGIIRQNAPELSPEQVETLLRSWVPEEIGRPPAAGTAAGRTAAAGDEQPAIPVPALLSMVRSFVAFSTGAMSPAEQTQLRGTMADWPRRYWERFPSPVRELITALLRERIGADEFWQAVRFHLFGKAEA